jgi:hypothetical protein
LRFIMLLSCVVVEINFLKQQLGDERRANGFIFLENGGR